MGNRIGFCCGQDDDDGCDRLLPGSLLQEDGGTGGFINADRHSTGAFGRYYAVKEQLGKGSTAACYACTETATGNWFAVKIINKKKISVMYSDLLPQFRKEVEILQKLDHPNIIELKEVFESENKIHVVTELARGGELFEYLVSRPNGTLTEASVSFLIRQCISAVAHMHQHGVIHRDIKLENILLRDKPRDPSDFKEIQLKIIDFGLSKSLGTPFVHNTAKTFFGTVGYIAPEMMKRQAYTRAIDVWALGVVTFVLLCGVFPFDDNGKKTFQQIDYRLRYPSWVAGLSDSAKDLLSQLLEIDPKKRITAAAALQHPWVSGRTASPRLVLNSPGHLRDLLKSPLPTVDALTLDSISLEGDAAGNANSISPLMLDHNVVLEEEEGDDDNDDDDDDRSRSSSSSSSLGSPSLSSFLVPPKTTANGSATKQQLAIM